MTLQEAYNKRKESLADHPFCFEAYHFEQLDIIYRQSFGWKDLLIFPEDYSTYPYQFLHTLSANACIEKKTIKLFNGSQEFNDDDVLIFEGDVHVKGHLNIHIPTYILGDLTVDGVLFIDEYCPLFTAGHIKTGSIETYAPVYAGTTIEATELICCAVNSHSYCVALQKSIRTKLYIENLNTVGIEKYDATYGNIDARYIYMLHQSDAQVQTKFAQILDDLKPILRKDILETTKKESGFLNTRICFEYLKEGQNIWK